MKITKIKNKISSKEVSKRIIRVATLFLSSFLLLETGKTAEINEKFSEIQFDSLYDINPLLDEINPTPYDLDSFLLLVENHNGIVKHHFVLAEEEKKEETLGYTKTSGNYKSVTNSSLSIPYASYNYGEVFEYNPISQNSSFIPDINITYQIVNKNNLNLDKLYTKKEIKDLEEKLDNNLVNDLAKSFNSKHNIYNLFLYDVNGYLVIGDTSNMVEALETTSPKDGANLYKVYYMYNIADPRIAIKFKDTNSAFKNHLSFFEPNKNLDFMKVTSMDHDLNERLNSGIRTKINLFDYLTEEQIKSEVITDEEILEILNNIKSTNKTTRFM